MSAIKEFYVPGEDIPIIVLSPEQLNYLISDPELNQKLPKYLRPVKDIFVFGCTVALRYSDLMRLKKDNLQFYNNAYYLRATSIKTDTNTTIKLPDYAVAILKTYHKKQKTLLPVYSKGYLNRGLKQLGTFLDFKETLTKVRTKRGVKYQVYKNKTKRQHYTLADHITSHTMRRTAITFVIEIQIIEGCCINKFSKKSAFFEA